ncbi:MAG: lipopolysaccharide heptosyltransferase II [Deltaproteobacteria bacterium]|nr:lipopolysaccharide heptosyltransferase II [Deltaproteobacteria bacterium]
MRMVPSKKQIEPDGVRRILVIATSWVGDAVMSLPALEAVGEIFPESTVAVMAKPWVQPLFACHPAVDSVVSYPAKVPVAKEPWALFSAAKRIREGRYDLAVLFQNAFRAGLMPFLAGVKYRLGYNTDGRGILLTHSVALTEDLLSVHQVTYYTSILASMGWPVNTVTPVVHLCGEDRSEAERILLSNGIGGDDFVVALGPGAVFGDAKRWPADRFATIGDWAARRWGAKILLMGSRNETGICDELSRGMTTPALNLAGATTLMQALALLSISRLFVTNDSGLMHAAAALGTPTVAVFGSTDPRTTSPIGPRVRLVRHPVPCAPCLKPSCPTDHKCMLSIGPEDVWRAMVELREEPM